MLKNRQEGLLFLHGLMLDVAIVVLFLVQLGVTHWTGLIRFNYGVNWTVYLMGVIVAMVWNHHALPAMASRLGVLTLRETLRLTRQQLFRLMAVLFAVGFATQDVLISRGFIAWYIGFAGVLLLLLNWMLPRRLAAFLFSAGKFRTLVLATSRETERLRSWLSARDHLGHMIVGCLLPAGETAPVESHVSPLGRTGDLRRVLADQQVNQIVINPRHFTADELALVAAEAERVACRVRYFADLHDVFGEEMGEMENYERYVFAAQTCEPLDNPVNSLLKRALDLTVAVPVVCFVLPPLTLAVWVMQRLQSKGSVFYRQERSGLNGRRFHILKFRTMHANPQQESRQATLGDVRVFPFGRFLRKTSLDEFPQFINVLLGDMSVSGPRPHLLEHDRQFAALVGSYYKRHYVKPGITGLAQSAGFRGEVFGQPALLRQRIKHDLRYVNMWSLELDLKIIAATARQVVRPPRAAY